MEQRNCKNCGAPLEHSYNHKCPYCGTLYDFNEPKEKVIECTPQDLINLELRLVEFVPLTNHVILLFSGYKCEMPKVFEVNGKNNYISKVETYINPPKCSFCIELDKTEIEMYGLQYILEMINRSGIRYSELKNVHKQIYGNKDIAMFCQSY